MNVQPDLLILRKDRKKLLSVRRMHDGKVQAEVEFFEENVTLADRYSEEVEARELCEDFDNSRVSVPPSEE